MIPNDDHTLLEIYKLHTELSERVAVLREDLSKLYASVVTSIVAASVIAHRISPDTRALWVLPALGMLLSVAWMLSLKSVTGRLSAKHLVLKELESKLPFDFLYRENTEFDRLGHPRRRLTAELLPWVFLVVCFAWLVVLVLAAICGDSVDTAPLAAGQ